MNRRTFIKSIGLGAAVAVMPGALAQEKKGASPNFVFVLVDDMGWTGLSVSMNDKIPNAKSDFYKTPHTDAFAAESMRFSNAYSPSSMCTPSRASCLTGQSPAKLRMTTPGPARKMTDRKVIPPLHVRELPEDTTTIAEILKAKGYATAHFGKWHLSGGGPGKHSFDEHDGDTDNKPPQESTENAKEIFGITERTDAFMTKYSRKKKPFYVQLYALHSPSKSLDTTKAKFAKLRTGSRHHHVDNAAMTSDLDDSFGTLLARIKELGIADNTYVVFMSDNGAGSGPRNRRVNEPLSGSKATLKEGGIRVPLIVRGPGVAANSFCYDNVHGFDLFPTFCELAGVSTVPSDVEGTSLVSLLKGNKQVLSPTPRDLVFHFPHYGKGPKQVPESAILCGSIKLLKSYETYSVQLFDLVKDIGEKNDLSGDNPEKNQGVENQARQLSQKHRGTTAST